MDEAKQNQEITNLHQIDDVLSKWTDEMINPNRPIHVPHAVHVFAHNYWHWAIQAAMYEEAEELAHKDPSDVNFVALDVESVMRKGLEAVFMVGYRFSQKGYKLSECECGDLSDDMLKEFLRANGPQH